MRRFAVPVLVLTAMLATAFPGRATEGSGPMIELAVPGRSNHAHWAAAHGAFVTVVWAAGAAQATPDIYLAVSRDSGHTFGAPVRVNAVEGEARVGGELPPRVALVPRATSADPEIVVAYGSNTAGTEIKLARSTDGGRTFSEGRALQAPGAAGDRGWHALALDSTGAAHVMWLDHRGVAAAKAESHQHEEAAAMDGVAMALRSGLYYARDGGSPETERELVKGVCYCCKVAMAFGKDGALYAAWRHVYPGSIRDIAFLMSRDGGRTFAAPGRVSTDEWHLRGCPDDGPAMAVDGSGRVHVVWPTVVGGDTPEGALFYASSSDGVTFSPRLRIPTLGSPKPMHPQILVEADDRVVVAWDEVVSGVRGAAVRPIRFDEAGQPLFGSATRLGAAGVPSSYPLLVSTSRGVLAVYVEGKPGASVIRVVNTTGS